MVGLPTNGHRGTAEGTGPSRETEAPPRFSVVLVLGVARCGSTLLGRLLAMHPRILCLGELLRTQKAIDRGHPCMCGQPVPECSFWQGVLPGLRQATGLEPGRFGPETLRDLGRREGKDVVVDLSKTLFWRHERSWRDDGVAYVHVVRDSRGVLGSELRRGEDLDSTLAKHEKWMKRFCRFIDVRGDRAITVRYEDLCRSPEAELRRLCAFLGIAFDPIMLRPADKVHHFIHSSLSPYLRGSNDIGLDERWRKELSEAQRTAIETVMARLPCFRGMQL